MFASIRRSTSSASELEEEEVSDRLGDSTKFEEPVIVVGDVELLFELDELALLLLDSQ